MPADKAARQPNVSNLQQYAAFCAFPSPASVHDSLNSPTLENSLQNTQAASYQLPTTIQSPIDAADVHVLPTQPGDVRIESVVTPMAKEMPEPDMNLAVGGALAPVHTDLPARSPPRRLRPELRLPSFESLGIANPHHRFGLDGNLTTQSLVTDALQHPPDGQYAQSRFANIFSKTTLGQRFQDLPRDPGSKLPGGRAIQSPIRQLVNTLTPPADAEYINWTATPSVTTAMDSPSTDPGHGASAGSQPQSTAATGPSTIALPLVSLSQHENDQNPLWFHGAINTIVDNLRSRAGHSDSLRIFSHALPSPSPAGHIFSEVIAAVGNSTPGSASSPMTWINLFHAVPGKFNMQDIPRSPPATPGPAIGGEDYFTQKVFDSAVSIADYQQDLSQLPRSPCPVVPPNSVDVSIVERYIPPSSINEFNTMFDDKGPSILIDRLIELSPDNGSLLFVYPTRTGARTFMRDYLGPVLDPVLRGFAVTERFSADFNNSLSSMGSVDHLPEYEDLEHRMKALCTRLSQRNSAVERFHGRRPDLTLSHASRQSVRFSRDGWVSLWTKQEKARLREALTKHVLEMQKMPLRDDGANRRSATVLTQELLRSVETRSYDTRSESAQEVEISVFVITRSS